MQSLQQPPQTPLAERTPGVVGEFHAQGIVLNAAKVGKRHGFPYERMWYLGEPTTDPYGEDIGFVVPTSVVRESTLLGTVLLALGAAIVTASFRMWSAIPGATIGFAILGAGLGWFIGWAGLSARMGSYLMHGTAGGLGLKIGIPTDVTQTERERLAELAERALREAKAESIVRLDGSRVVNSPQSSEYIAVPAGER